MDSDTIKQAWLEVFSNSHASSRTIMGSTCVALYLQKPEEWANGISNNDPLVYKLWIEGDNVRESDLHVYTRPEKGSNLVYKSVGMRRQTIKQADHDKLVRRFKKVRDFVISQDLKHEVKIP